MIIKLVEVKRVHDFDVTRGTRRAHYELEEIWINPDSILQIKSDEAMRAHLAEGRLPAGLDTAQDFSRIQFGSGNSVNSVVVVGSPSVLAQRLHEDRRQLLKG